MTRKVVLDIGGTQFVTTEKTIARIPNLFQELEPDDHGVIFVDKDGFNFSYILNFMRDGSSSFLETCQEDTIREIARQAEFYKISELVALCASYDQPPTLHDLVKWRSDSIDVYWQLFVRHIVDDSLRLPFHYERNSHTLAKCIACEETFDPKCSYVYDIDMDEWSATRHHMQYMTGQVTQKFGTTCCLVKWSNGCQVHLPITAIRKANPSKI
uniref:BTB domain-containing protein n=1 Tax=Steinernema glaseri TaxID=37863 RepID=A0A1I7YJA5_9BILA